ncbi:GNAT family N-acetyltransferase [Natrialbaceae archaeon GCM10025810]|uniref:GNAT family N-acetyltransferase n=1 Tax=Halovalidus salilacus TaxID=3075124 RepID=UPI0036060E55
MSLHARRSFEDEMKRSIYEYVERRGAVTRGELARTIHVETGQPASKPARSRTYTEKRPIEPDELRAAVSELKADGHLLEFDGKLRVALSTTPAERELEGGDGTVTIRPAREEDRAGLIETMSDVGDDGTYIVAENVVEQLERAPALVRANDERSRVFFVAVRREDEGGAGDESAEVAGERDEGGEVVGWLHLDGPELPSLRHTAEVTVGVRPDHRREGIGSSLLEYGLEWAEESRYRKLYQSLPATNERAIEFLEDNGWEREGKREGHYCIDDSLVDEVLLATWTDGE